MKRFNKILQSLKNQSPIPFLLENGYTPSDIKAEIIDTFNPYFKNHENLGDYAIEFLVSDWINFYRMKIKYPGVESDIEKVLSSYNQAKSKNNQDTMNIISSMMSFHEEYANKFWSLVNLELGKKDLEIHEFAHVVMSDISNIIEGVSKSLYVENVLVGRIKRGKTVNIETTLSNKLGSLIQELIDNTDYKSIFIVPKENLKISDWRNIGAHNSYSVLDNKIHCTSGQGDKKVSFEIERKQLFERLSYCVRTTEILNIVHKIFVFDNLSEISLKVNKDNSNLRPEVGFLMFSSALMSQGFEIQSINYNSDYASLELIDLTQGDPLERGIHSSQFLNQFWLLTNSEFLEIKYLKNDNNLYLTSSISNKVFYEMEKHEKKDVSYFANNISFKFENGR